jgi:hypothetical protein
MIIGSSMFTRVNSKCAHQARPPLGWVRSRTGWHERWAKGGAATQALCVAAGIAPAALQTDDRSDVTSTRGTGN